MSLLNSVLSSINGSQAAASNPSTSKPNPSARKENGIPTVATSRPQPISANIAPKRKAEDPGRDVKPKLARVDTNTTLAPPPSRSATTSPAQRQGAPLPRSQVPYRGTAGPSTSKPVPATSASSRPVASAPATPTGAAPAPAKSGYLAVLERAKAAQAAAKEIGQIRHKPVEKLTKKDRLRMQAEAAAAAKGKKPVAKAGSQGLKGRSKSAEPTDPKAGGPVKEKRKPIDVGYKGTMRAAPSAPSYSGTMRGPGAAPRKSAPPASRGPSYRYADYSDEEEEDEEEEQDYDSESDMEAGLDEVDFEEEESARIAKREDAEALRLENQLKKEKAEKKRKLEQMAAAAAAKKKRY